MNSGGRRNGEASPVGGVSVSKGIPGWVGECEQKSHGHFVGKFKINKMGCLVPSAIAYKNQYTLHPRIKRKKEDLSLGPCP